MSNKSGIEVNFDEFNKNFAKIVQDAIPKDAARGLFNAGNELLSDAIKVEPYAPFREGHLRGSAQVNKAEIKNNEISLAAGFNIEYAAKLHELTQEQSDRTNWTLPGSGRKYLEFKMFMFMKKYMQMVADYIKSKAK